MNLCLKDVDANDNEIAFKEVGEALPNTRDSSKSRAAVTTPTKAWFACQSASETAILFIGVYEFISVPAKLGDRALFL